MNDLSFPCPHCAERIELTEALAAPLIRAEQAKVAELVEARLQSEMSAIAATAADEARQEMHSQLIEKEAAIQQRDQKLAEAQQLEREARKAKADAEAIVREQELKTERAVEAAKEVAAKAASDHVRQSAQRDIDSLREKLEIANARSEKAEQLERETRKAKAEAEAALREQDLRVERAVHAAKEQAAKAAADDARKLAQTDIALLREQLADAKARSENAEQAEIAARKAKQEAEDAQRRTELEVVRRLDEERAKVRDAVIDERDRQHRLAMADKEKVLGDLRKQIDDLRRTGSAGSQQLAGDVLELDLAQVLGAAFPGDHFERVTKGHSGGDVLQRVMTVGGAVAGTILWESKRTKTWQEPWLGKLRDDQRNAKADIAIIASETLPSGISTFGPRDGVWVTGLAVVVPVAAALRVGMLDASRARAALAAADTTKDFAYAYLTGKEFQQRVTRAVEACIEMTTDLEKERRAVEKMHAARAKQITRVMSGIGGLYGDLQGIFGPSLPEVVQLSLPSTAPAHPKLTDGGEKTAELEEV